ncbi:MAG: hypothetical protein U0797_18125 [Gemmataceae bacterium]
MAPRQSRHRRVVGWIFLPVIAWLALAGSCRADSPVHYFAERTFEIPFSTEPSRKFRRIHLHVSTDDGKTYSAAGSTLDRQGAFTYTARGDGWYFFVVQIEEMDGGFSPPRVNAVQPSLRVCVDTEKPKATLRAVQPQKTGTVAVEWTVSDPNLDLQTLRLQYRATGGARWLPLDIKQMAGAQFEWNPPGAGPFEVRLLVSDKANQTTEVKTEARADPSRAGAGAGGGGFARSGAVATGDRKVIYVNRRTFKLNYAIDGAGPSKVKHVEVWITRDTTSWQIYKQNAPSTGPCEVTVNAQGRFGFTLRPVSGVGRGGPAPRAGDLPQVWVEVDETAPIVRLVNVTVNEGADAGTMTVTWQASDKFLGDTPITILYSPTNSPDAKWEVLQQNVENTGSSKCKNPEGMFEFYVRIEAADRAGNKSHDHTREKVNTDLSEPKVTDVNVSIGDPANKPPG